MVDRIIIIVIVIIDLESNHVCWFPGQSMALDGIGFLS